MKKTLLLNAALMISACFCQGATLTIGSPNFNPLTGVTLSPTFGTVINFDNLPAFGTVAANAYAAQGVQSITSNMANDPLVAYPFSLQSAPNELTTASGEAGGITGGITIAFSNPVSIVGIGLEESDGRQDTLTLLGVSGSVLATFTETVPSSGPTPFNAYYVLSDITNDIKSLTISSATGNFGVDDLQLAPEPLSFTLIPGGLLLLALIKARKAKAMPEDLGNGYSSAAAEVTGGCD